MIVAAGTVAINICYERGEGFIDNDERVASSKGHTQFNCLEY